MKYLKAWLKGVAFLAALATILAAAVGLILWPTLLPAPWDLRIAIPWWILMISTLIGSLFYES